MKSKKEGKKEENAKTEDLSINREDSYGEYITTNQGVRLNDDHNSLKAGERGATLMEDFHFREKLTHFDHERIPERIVHARGTGAHGVFECTESMTRYTKAKFLQTPGTKTPVFVRFSTVVGSRGSTDLARDVRGFATKFYTEEGNYDLVGNNMPPFFIQDAIKFPDLVHSIKPEPHNEIPQASAAHDTFWDFISLTPESAHMIMWVLSDRAIPRSYRMMEGFGVHTFRFVNEQNESFFVKFHWKPVLGLHSVLWDEAQKISGLDPDFHRRDLTQAIEEGNYPEWHLGVQIVEEKDEFSFDFDLLDPTKLIPEELVPVKIIGKMTLNRNVDNFFAETEQVAFHPGHVVSGIDFTNDPLLQGRLFSYLDTQLIRLGGPNFHEIPINRPIAPVHNNQRDGHMRQTINRGVSSYSPNTTGEGAPVQAKASEGGYVHHQERVDGRKIRARSASFFDFFSQATLFYNSQTETEKDHIVDAFLFELGKVQKEEIRKRMVTILTQIDNSLAQRVADGLGISPIPEPDPYLNRNIPADGDPQNYQNKPVTQRITISKALSMSETARDSVKGRMIAVLAAEGVVEDSVMKIKEAFKAQGASIHVVSSHLGDLKAENGNAIKVDKTFLTTGSVLYDALLIPDGEKSIQILMEDSDAKKFINETFKHCKAIAIHGKGIDLLNSTEAGKIIQNTHKPDQDHAAHGILINRGVDEFIRAVAQHRFWDREKIAKVPA
jgi:catalase